MICEPLSLTYWFGNNVVRISRLIKTWLVCGQLTHIFTENLDSPNE